MVEAACELRHLVTPLDLDAHGEIAGSKGFDLRLQPFESSRDAPHNRIGPQRYGDGQQAKCSEQAQSVLRQRRRQRGTDGSEAGASSAMHGEIDRQQAPEMLYCSLQLVHRALWSW